MKTIGVIAKTIKDFQEWKIEQDHKSTIGSSSRIYIHNNIKYICMSKKYHCIGYNLDELIETSNAKNNPEYNEILKFAAPCLKIEKNKCNFKKLLRLIQLCRNLKLWLN